MQVRFSARGNFRPLETSLRGLNQSMNRSMAGMGRAAINVGSPLDDLNKKLNRGRLGFADLGHAVRNQNRYLREHNAMVNASGTAYRNAAGGATVMLDANRGAASNMVKLGQRLSYTNNLMHAFGRNTIAMGKNMQWAGRQVMVGLTLPLGLLAAAATSTAEEYDRNMTRIIKVNSEASDAAMHSVEKFDMVSESARRQTSELVDLGASMGFLASETTETIAEFAQMGYVGASLDQLSDAAMQLSYTTGSELDTSIEATRITAQAFNVDLQDLNEQFARLNIVENNTALSVKESVIGLPVVGAVANAVNMDLQETNGLMAMMKNSGISAKEGATALRTGLLQLVQDAGEPTVDAFENIGLNLDAMKEKMYAPEELGGGGGDILNFFEQLDDHRKTVEGNREEMDAFAAALSKLFGVRQTSRIFSFLEQFGERMDANTAGGKAWLGVMSDTEDAMAVYEFEQEQIRESAAGTADRLRAELNVEMVRLGENFLDVANSAREFAVNILRWFNTLDDSTKNTILRIGGLIAALGPLTMIAGIIANAFGQVITVVTRVVQIILPKFGLVTAQQRAMEIAFQNSARAIGMENTMLQQNIALKRGAAGAAGHTAAAVGGGAAGGAGVAAGGAARGAGAAAGGARAGAGAGMLIALAAKGPVFAKIASALALGAKAAMAIGAAFAAVKGIIIGIAAALVAIPILSNPQAFMEGLRNAIAGPLENLRNTWERISDQVSRIINLFNQAGDEGSGLAKVSWLIGTIVGMLMNGVIVALDIVLGLVEPLIPAFESVMHLIDMIASYLTGDIEAGNAAFHEWWKAIGRTIFEVLAWLLDSVAAIADTIPMLNIGQEHLRGWADELRNAEFLASSTQFAAIGIADAIKESVRAEEALNERLEVGRQQRQDMLRQGMDLEAMTDQQILDNEWLTDEMKHQELILRRKIKWQEHLNNLIAKMKEIENREFTSMGQHRENQLAAETVLRQKEQVMGRIQDIEESTTNQVRQRSQLHGQELTSLEDLGDTMTDIARDADNFDTSAAGAAKNIADTEAPAASTAKSAKDISDNTSKIARDSGKVKDNAKETAKAQRLQERIAARQQQQMERLEAQAAKLRDRIQESEQAAQRWASQLQSGMSEVMSDIAGAVRNALEEQIERAEQALDRREKRAEERNEAERKRIEDRAQRELDKIDAVQKREEEQEAARRRWFENQRARIAYLRTSEQQNVSMDEAIARGDVAEATRIRIGLQRDAEAFMLESYERERDKYQEAKQDEFEAQREKIEKVREAQLEALAETEKKIQRQFELEREAAQKSAENRRRSVEQYLRDWERITPATEKEFRRHLSALSENMRGFGINMHDISRHYTRESGRTITRGFTDAINIARRVIQEQDKWERVGRNSGAAFRAGLAKELAKIEGDIERLRKAQNVNIGSSSGGVSSSAGGVSGGGGGGGGGSAPSSSAGGGGSGPAPATLSSSGGSSGSRGAGGSSGSSPFHALNTLNASVSTGGMLPRGQVPNQTRNSSRLNQNTTRGGGSMRHFHDGGDVKGPSYPGLKPDETPAVLQHGEYVIQRDAVKGLGKDFLDSMNSVRRFHDGGLIDFSRSSINEGGALKAAAGFGLGGFATQVAAAISKEAGFDPKITSRYDGQSSGQNIGARAGKQIGSVVTSAAQKKLEEEAAKAQAASQLSGGSGWRRQAGSGWPPRSWGRVAANTRAAQNYWRGRARFPGGIGAGENRGVRRSDHSWGKALDFMVAPLGRYARGSQKTTGDRVANWHIRNPGRFGTSYVIWDKKINSGRGWRNYTRYGSNPGATLGHYDHVHVSYLHDGGMVTPSLQTGGKIKTNNTIANLHKGERVLTEPSTRALETAVQEFARSGGSGGGNTYHLDFHVDGGNIDEKALAKKVVFEIDRMERTKGRKRVIRE